MSDSIHFPGLIGKSSDQERSQEDSLYVQERRVYLFIKRTVDVVACVVAFPVASFIVAILSVLILFSMGRPVFFSQDRVGLGGKIFKIYKLRTMQDDAAGLNLETATLTGDPRITPLGSLMRRSHLDELPQLWNIFVGDMTLIGPRPEQPQLVIRYAQDLAGYDVRHSVTPGLSGLAQVSYGYAADLAETRVKLEYDVEYIKKMGPLLDIKIAVLTLRIFMDRRYVR